MTPKDRFEQLLKARDSEFDGQRKALFADAASVAYLAERRRDADPVVAFIGRHLHVWATQQPPEINALDDFLRIGIFARKAQKDRTAAGWQPDLELSYYIQEQGNKPAAVEHLLLLALMQPHLPFVLEGADLYFNHLPVPVPEVLIRINLEWPRPGGIEGLTTLALQRTQPSRTVQALNHERARAGRLKLPYPVELESLRSELLKSHPR